MVFIGVYRAIYDYAPQADNEISIRDGDLVFVLEKDADGDWWKVKRKASEDEEEEPEGLVPSNYIEEAQPLYDAKALYDYSRQTDEEISFHEEAPIQIYDETDPDWTLVEFNGEFGFAPSNYIDKSNAQSGNSAQSAPAEDGYDEHDSGFTSPSASPIQSPAAALAGIIQQRTGPSNATAASVMSPPRASTYTPDASDEDDAPPSLPSRPQASSTASYDKALPQPPGAFPSPSQGRSASQYDDSSSGSGFRMYHIHEMISHMGRNRKMPTVFGINVARGILSVAPESERLQQEWTAEKMTHYSLEGKHVFVELVRPSKSIDFHAGNKDTASEIVSVLGEVAGAARAAGLREVLAIGNGAGGQKTGQMLYEFMAQGEDEVTVAVGDEVIVLDDSQSEEWWKVRRVKNGKEGVVPSSYVEITGSAPAATSSPARASTSYSVEQNRRDEQRMTMDVVRSLPQEENKKERRKESRSAGASKPNSNKVRQWTDRSGSFKVDAEFLGIKDGKIHLHKTNGVKIAVPIDRMSPQDVEYVEGATGQSFSGDKSSDGRRQDEQRRSERGGTGAAVQQPEGPRYDWFEFFLQSGCAPQICERYAMAFERDQMSEENLQDVNAGVLRTLGLKEGDILRVMKFLDTKYSRVRPPLGSNNSASNADGLFSGPDGVLRNNTAKGRPVPPVETNNTVDPRMFEQSKLKKDQPSEAPAPEKPSRQTTGFDDDAWDNKPSRQNNTATQAQPQRPAMTGAMEQLSLLSPALQPTPAPQPIQSAPAQQIQQKATGANPSFFDQLAQQTGTPQQRPQLSQLPGQSLTMAQPPMRAMSAPGIQPNFQQQGPLRPQVTGMQPMPYQMTGYGYAPPNGLQPQVTGYPSFPQQQPLQPQPQYLPYQQTGYTPQIPYQQTGYMTMQPTGSPFADPPRASFQPQMTGYPQSIASQQTGMNYMPLQPAVTGLVNGNGFGQAPSQLPSMQQQNTMGMTGVTAPLVPQKTGPPPPIRFGVTPAAQKLTPQMTGRRANLAQATPQNPFGF